MYGTSNVTNVKRIFVGSNGSDTNVQKYEGHVASESRMFKSQTAVLRVLKSVILGLRY